MEVPEETGHVEVDDGRRVGVQEEVDDPHLLVFECGRKPVHAVHSTLVEEAHDVDASKLGSEADVSGPDDRGVGHIADSVDIVFATGFLPDNLRASASSHRTRRETSAVSAAFVVGAISAVGRHVVRVVKKI